MSADSKISWRISGEGAGSCNCAWGCPCQFNALPTHGRCEGFGAFLIEEGFYGSTRMDGVRFAGFYWWPGPVHLGDGIRQFIIDEKTTPEQREALMALQTGTQGGSFFEIFSAVCPTVLEPIIAPIHFESDREKRKARVRIDGFAELTGDPILNPITGEEHRARIVLPDGFEYKEAEMANASHWHVRSKEPLIMEHKDTYCQLNTFDWSN